MRGAFKVRMNVISPTPFDQKCLSYSFVIRKSAYHTISYNFIRTENCGKLLREIFSYVSKIV